MKILETMIPSMSNKYLAGVDKTSLNERRRRFGVLGPRGGRSSNMGVDVMTAEKITTLVYFIHTVLW